MKIGVRVTCVVCDRDKAPVGRSVPFGVSMCDHECSGYYTAPLPGSLWPGETEEVFGYPVGPNGVREESNR